MLENITIIKVLQKKLREQKELKKFYKALAFHKERNMLMEHVFHTEELLMSSIYK